MQRATSFSNYFKRMNHGAFSTVTSCPWKKNQTKPSRKHSTDAASPLPVWRMVISTEQWVAVALALQGFLHCLSAHFSAVLQCCLDTSRRNVKARLPSLLLLHQFLQTTWEWGDETHVQVEAYSWMQWMTAFYCLILGGVSGDLKLRSKSCKHLHVVGITPIRSWGQVHCGF